MHLSRRSTPAVLATTFLAVALAPAAAQARTGDGAFSSELRSTQRHIMQTHCAVKDTSYLTRRVYRR